MHIYQIIYTKVDLNNKINLKLRFFHCNSKLAKPIWD